MNDYWSETGNLFKDLIDEPEMKDKYLKKPSPKFIFLIVINTMKQTGFPDGLFTQKEQNIEFFMANIYHKKKFLVKITELINYIINEESGFQVNIDVQDILKGLNPQKTNEFLRYVYKFAKSGKDYSDIINKYKIQRSEKKYIYQNIEIPKGEAIDEKGYILWIDKDVKSEENKKLLDNLEDNPQYQQIKNFEFICLNNLNNAFIVLKMIKFKIVYIIINGNLYPEYYYKLKKYKNLINCIPVSVIYASDDFKNVCLKRLRHYSLNNEIYESINNSYYNYGGITSDFYSCLDFVSNFYFGIKNKFFPKFEKKITYKNIIYFEKINSEMQLIIPFLFNELLNEENKISDNEIQYFKYMLLNRHGNDKIINRISPILFTKDMPHELMLKYFIRAYTEKASFYESINNSLIKNQGKEYLAFINLLYEALSYKNLQISEEDYLYRYINIEKNKIDLILEKFANWNKNEDKSIPLFLVYSCGILSFTKDKNKINVIPSINENEYHVIFKLKNDDKIINKYTYNIDIEDISVFKEEKEVLFLPFTTFILSNIYNSKNNEQDCIIIEIEYLGKYESLLNNYNKGKIKKYFMNCFKKQNYLNELIKKNLIGANFNNEEEKISYILDKVIEKIRSKFNILIDKDEYSVDEINYKEIINANERLTFNSKNYEKEELSIDLETLNNIHERNEYSSTYTEFFIPYFKEENIEYIWKGKYNKFNEKEGKSQEFDLEDKIIFDGEYEKGKKIEGIEYYIKGNKKYEGEYYQGKRWNGTLYDIKGINKFKIINGKGKIKEFHENGCLLYDGEMRDGIKDGHGKIFDESGHLLYEGELVNGKKEGKGKEYNRYGDLIFDGEFENGKRGEGKIYIYNDRCELISEKTYKRGHFLIKNYKSIKDYKCDLMINGQLCLMEDIHIDKGKEHKVPGKYIFEGEYIDGKQWKGKFKKYNDNNILFIEGEFKNGIKSWKEYDEFQNLIFEGIYENEYEYKGKEYINEKLKFEGKFKNGKRISGKEYNNEGNEVFNGTYKDGKRWNGKLKVYRLIGNNFKLIFDGELKKGKKWNGLSSSLGFEGVYKNGKKWNGKGKEQIRKSNMIFQGEFLDGMYYNGNFYTYNGSGKMKNLIGNLVKGSGNNIKKYNYGGNLIFEGDFIGGKYIYGKEYNNLGEIIYEGKYKNGKKYEGIYKIKMHNHIYTYYILNSKVSNKFIDLNKEIIYEGEYNEGLKEGKGKEFNKNGNILFEGDFLNGYRYNGKEFDDDGKLLFEGKYKKGIPFNGIKKEYINGLLRFEGEIKNGLKLKGREYDQFSNIIFEGEYQNGVKYKGKEKYTKDLIFEGEYKEGTIYKGKDFDINNRIRFEGEYKNKHRYKGKEFNENNELIFEGNYKFYCNTEIRWIGNGKEYQMIKQPPKEDKKELIYEGEYLNGKKWNGKGKEFNPDGTLLFEGEYKNGKKYFGKLYKKGELIFEGEIKNSEKRKKDDLNQNSQIINGSDILNKSDIKIMNNKEDKDIINCKYYKEPKDKYYILDKLIYEKKKIEQDKYSYIEYNCYGQIIFEGEYLNNQKYKGKEYNDYGEIIYEGDYNNGERFNGKGYNNCNQFSYINGKIEGNLVVYDLLNNELFEGEYKNGEKYKGALRTYFDGINFILKRIVEVREGKISGKGKEYYKNKRLKYEGEYLNGIINGKGTLYYENSGYINYIGEFKNGEKHGLGKEYDKFGNVIYEGIFEEGEKKIQ